MHYKGDRETIKRVKPNFSYTDMDLQREIDEFERKHGAVKYAGKTLKKMKKNFNSFNNAVNEESERVYRVKKK